MNTIKRESRERFPALSRSRNWPLSCEDSPERESRERFPALSRTRNWPVSCEDSPEREQREIPCIFWQRLTGTGPH